MRRCIPLSAALLLAVAAAPAAHAQHEGDFAIYSSAPGSGALVVAGPLDEPVRVTPRLPFCPGNICPYSATDPGFITPASGAGAGRFALTGGTRISLVLVAIDAAASVKIGATVLRAAGESAVLGDATGLHVHPEWQAQAPPGVVRSFSLAFRLTTNAPAYAESAVYEIQLSNGTPAAASATPSATPTPTARPASPTPTSAPPSPTATASPPPSPSATAPPDATPSASATASPSATPSAPPPPCTGDCNGDGMVTINELITGVALALGSSSAACDAFDTDGDGTIAIHELIAAVNRALDGC